MSNPDGTSRGAPQRDQAASGGRSIPVWQFWLACLLAAGSLLFVSFRWFRVWQLPQWIAWVVAIMASAAAVAWLRSSAKRGSLSGYVAVGTLIMLAAGTLALEWQQAGGPSSDGVLERPVVVLATVPPDDSSAAWRQEALIQGMASLPGRDVVIEDARTDGGNVASPGVPLVAILATEDGAGASVRLLGAEGQVLWRHDWSSEFDLAASEAIRLLGELAVALDIPVDESLETGLERQWPGSADVPGPFYGLLGEWRRFGPLPSEPESLLSGLDRILRLEPDFAPAQSLRANVMLAAGKALDGTAALQLSGLGDDARAHQALAKVLAWRWESAGAAEQSVMAMQLGPNDPWIHLDSAVFFAWTGACGEARRLADRAGALAPVNDVVALEAGRVAFLCGDLDTAEARVARATGLSGAVPSLLSASIHAAGADEARSIAALQAYERSSDRTKSGDALAAYLYALVGAGADAARLAGPLLEPGTVEDLSAIAQGLTRMAGGDYLGALRTLREVREMPVAAHDAFLIIGLARNAWLDPLLNEPAFRDIRRILLQR